MKTFLTLFLLLCAATARTQPQRGHFLLNAAGYGSFEKRPGQAKHAYSFTSHLGGYYFLTDRLAVGLQGELYRRGWPAEAPFKNNIVLNAFRVGPALRYYVPLGRKTAFLLQGAAGVLFHTAQSNPAPSFPTDWAKTRGMYAYVSPGFAWYPTSRLSLEATLGEIGYQKNWYDQGSSDKTIGLLSLNPKLGISFLIGSPRKTRQSAVLME